MAASNVYSPYESYVLRLQDQGEPMDTTFTGTYREAVSVFDSAVDEFGSMPSVQWLVLTGIKDGRTYALRSHYNKKVAR